MNVFVAVIVIGAMISLSIGLVTSAASLLSQNERPPKEGGPHRPIVMATGPVYWSFTIWTIILGVVLMTAPESWYGPSWSYFSIFLPHNGFGMGLCLTVLSGLQAWALWRGSGARKLAILFFLNGFVYWTAGIVLGAEGLLGHAGLMESPFMLYVGAHAFAHSAALTVYTRNQGGHE
jgi:hypothetical protein